MTDAKYHTDYLFDGVETLRQSRFSHYLIDHEFILEMKGYEAIYLYLKSINDKIDKLDTMKKWGILYPIVEYFSKLKKKKYKGE